MSWTNQTKNTTSFSNQSKKSTSFTNQAKNLFTVGYLLLETGFKLLLETGGGILQENEVTVDAGWANQTKN